MLRARLPLARKLCVPRTPAPMLLNRPNSSQTSTELYAVADFCVTPVGTGPSVREYIAECQRVLQKSGLKYKMHGYGTNIEGPWSLVSQAVYDCHAVVHAQDVPRVTTDLRIETRTDRQIAPGEGNEGKVKVVENILAEDKT